MNRCSSSHGSLYGPCSCCGYFQAPANSFSMFFMDDPYASSSSSSVDCTLSLGTPSTRQSSTSYNFSDHHPRASTSSSSGSKKLSWDIFQSKKSSSSSSASKTSRSNGNAGNGNGDSLLARRCANCDTTSTPLWRNGPRGPKSLCNACGIRYKKEERRAANSSSTSTSTTSSNATMMESHSYMGMGHQQWGHQGNEFRFIEDNDGDSTTDTAIPFLSWRLNVPVHDYS